MRLKLDLHPIYNDSKAIEAALQGVIEEAVDKRAKEVEIIPGKGSGALKKSVLRFLQRPEIQSRYHRLEKDSDNWGRLFVHFRHERLETAATSKPAPAGPSLIASCACCDAPLTAHIPEDEAAGSLMVLCPSCDSPNQLTYRKDRRGVFHATAELHYEDT